MNFSAAEFPAVLVLLWYLLVTAWYNSIAHSHCLPWLYEAGMFYSSRQMVSYRIAVSCYAGPCSRA